ncbi:hypothetical protein [Brevundimonas goettingensis]|uniref:Uncharacterized protein n=1 Tax=Brevundimonas goettingensis TaxID=2774190 RepID=A0A975C4I5_9CAUL|nr:hypothetical protein [Brevundimonas goettingensis]QTC92329.1 hypothetical protein IFJ75_05395 [Brevundimonas goettingensis]
MAFLDWIAPLSPVKRDETRERVFSADMCPLTWSFWVVDAEESPSADATVRGDPRRRTSGEA